MTTPTKAVPKNIEYLIRTLAVLSCIFFTPFVGIPLYGMMKIVLILAFNDFNGDAVDAYVKDKGRLG
jgi:hypothetical protein